MIIVIAQIGGRGGKPGKIDIISRGLTHMKEQGRLIHEMAGVVKKALRDGEPRMKPQDKDLRDKVRRALEKFVFQRTHRQPMILPVIVEV